MKATGRLLLMRVVVATTACSTGSSSTSSGTSASPDVVLQVRAVKEIVPPDASTYGDLTPACAGTECSGADLPADADVVLEDAEGNRYRLGHVILSQDNINDAQARHDESIGAPAGSWTVEISLDGDGTDQLASATQAAASAAPPTNQIAVVVDGRVMIAPTVQAPITSGRLEVTGLEESQAQALVALGTVSPTA